tara:strand:- start:1222 stop:1500 length:279 start_codon:yes stop_codon:yes gene_type:complete
MAILPLCGAEGLEPIRIVHVSEDLIWLFVPARAEATGPESAIVPISGAESPLVDLSDAATIGIVANYDNPPDAESVEVARQIVEGLEQDLPF